MPSKTESSAKAKQSAAKTAKSRAAASKAKAGKPGPAKPAAAKSTAAKSRRTASQKSPNRKAPAAKAKTPKAAASKTTARKAAGEPAAARRSKAKTKLNKKPTAARNTKGKAKPAPAEGAVILSHPSSGGEDRESAAPAASQTTAEGSSAGDMQGPTAPPTEELPRTAAARPIIAEKTNGDGEDGGDEIRVNKLVATNAVHPTERRLRRGMGPARAMMALGGFAVIGLAILSTQQPDPPALTPLERQAASAPASAMDSTLPFEGPHGPAHPVVTVKPRSSSLREMISPLEMMVLEDAPAAAPAEIPAGAPVPGDFEVGREAQTTFEFSVIEDQVLPAENEDSLQTAFGGTPPWLTPATQSGSASLSSDELAELDRLLAQLDLGWSPADGVVDGHTEHAIRLYQQIAGLPVDGEPSAELLADMREVVRILESGD